MADDYAEQLEELRDQGVIDTQAVKVVRDIVRSAYSAGVKAGKVDAAEAIRAWATKRGELATVKDLMVAAAMSAARAGRK